MESLPKELKHTQLIFRSPILCSNYSFPFGGEQGWYTQLPGGLFSPKVIYGKKLTLAVLLLFSFGMGTYVHQAKYQGVFMNLQKNT